MIQREVAWETKDNWKHNTERERNTLAQLCLFKFSSRRIISQQCLVRSISAMLVEALLKHYALSTVDILRTG
jgi:hypothetical protein